MSTAITPQPANVVMDLPLSLIVPSKTNRRHQRNREKDDEMLESIKLRGVIQNIVVRPQGQKYEIVCGHRRVELSAKAGKETVPATVRNLTDIEALEIQNIENLQREDLDPFDRAMAVLDLVTAYRKAGEKAPIVMATQKLNCKDRTLYNLMSLANLIDPAKTSVRAGEMSLSVAYEIAREDVNAQRRIGAWIKDQTQYQNPPPTVRKVKEFIRQHFHLLLDSAPWKKDDATLLPAAGACSSCLKNTAVNPALAETARPTCTDSVCYQQKMAAHLVVIEKAAKQSGQGCVYISQYHTAGKKGALGTRDWKEAKKGSCVNLKTGIYVEGEADKIGTTRPVCSTPGCKVHFIQFARMASAPERNRDIQRHQAASRAAARKTELRNAISKAQALAIRDNVKRLDLADLKAIVRVIFEQLDHDLKKYLVELMGWTAVKAKYSGGSNLDKPAFNAIDKMKPAEVSAFMVLVAIANETYGARNSFWIKPRNAQMAGFAKRHKINLDAAGRHAAKAVKDKWKAASLKKRKALKPKARAKTQLTRKAA